MSQFYIETPSHLARATGLHAWTIKCYCLRGQLDYIKDVSGRYLLRQGQEEKVKEILAANRAKQAKSLPRRAAQS